MDGIRKRRCSVIKSRVVVQISQTHELVQADVVPQKLADCIANAIVLAVNARVSGTDLTSGMSTGAVWDNVCVNNMVRHDGKC